MNVEENEYLELKRKADKLDSLIEELENHMGPYNEKEDKFEENEEADLGSIGEIVLTYLDLRR